MSGVSAVELRGVSKIYKGGVRAVDGVTLHVAAGSVVALIGPSGCGKTTTLRLINRLEEPTAGEVLVRGRNVRTLRPERLRRSIGYVIQEGGLLPHLTVAANVALVPRLLRWERTRVRQRVGQVLELVGLPETGYGRRMPAELSGGQRQRVGVARALAADPDLLLMDEPFGALDPGTREAIQDEFMSLQARLGKTVVLVTHDMAEAGRLAQEIVLLDHGRILQQGTLRDILVRPAGERVRAFLGRRGHELVLGVLRLGELVKDLPTAPPLQNPLRLAANLPLGRVLAVLADKRDEFVALEGLPERTYSAGHILDRIGADLEAAGANDVAHAAPQS